MGNKVQIQDLVDSLVLNNHLSEDVSNNFVKTFFDTIVFVLQKEQNVKIKGLGTFKLVDVDTRESVDVNTGERIEIESHQKVAFTPEAALKKRINKPFEQFETVVINDGVDITSMESLNNKEVETASLNNSVNGSENSSEVTDKDTAFNSQAVQSEESPVKFEHKVSPMQMSLEIKKDFDAKQEETLAHEKKENRLLKIILSLLLLLILCVISYFIGYYRVLCPNCEERAEAAAISQKPSIEKVSVKIDSGKEDIKDSSLSSNKQTSVRPPESKEKKKNFSQEKIQEEVSSVRTTQFLNPKEVYRAVSTMTVHKMKSGENIYRLAQKYYGSKEFAVYIIRYNGFEEPDVLPVGTRVEIPLLKK